jgi:flagellar basal-body rod modification protein FlgD
MATDPISGASFADVMVQPTTTPKAQELGKDTFLKLLVAQLKYQNPMDPQNGAEFLAQSAQFTMVEKLQEIAAQGAEMRTLSSASLVGKTVSYTAEDGTTTTGVVEKVKQTPGGSILVVDGKNVALAQVTEVSQTATTPAAAAAPAAVAAPEDDTPTGTVDEDNTSTDAPDTAVPA